MFLYDSNYQLFKTNSNDEDKWDILYLHVGSVQCVVAVREICFYLI
jgi:hypothetical protein